MTQSTNSNFNGYRPSDAKKDAFSVASLSSIRMPVIILVNPFLDANVGSVARAMLNFGLTELRIVNPVCNIYSDAAQSLSAGAYEVILKAKVYTSLEDSITDLERVIATSVRPRHMTQVIYTPETAANVAISQENNVTTAFLFGREKDGLNNEEIALADSIVTIPTFNHFSSLNLAQAVNIIGYELFKRKLDVEDKKIPAVWLHPKDGERLAKRNEIETFFVRQERMLEERGFQTDPHRKILLFRYIRNIYNRVRESLPL